MTPRQLRIVRGVAASAVATLIAAVSHTVGGGHAPSPLLMLSVAVLLAPLAALFVGRTVRLISIVVAVAVTQVAFHLAFAVTGQLLVAGPPLGPHQHGIPGPADLALVTASPAHAVHNDALMLFAHICAAVITTVLLWHGELLLRTVVRWVRAVLRRPEPVILADTPFRTSVVEPLPTGLLGRILLGDVCRRGPPSVSCG